jgi:hypothetical protein
MYDLFSIDKFLFELLKFSDQRIDEHVVFNDNHQDVTFSQTEPLPPDPPFNCKFHSLLFL